MFQNTTIKAPSSGQVQETIIKPLETSSSSRSLTLKRAPSKMLPIPMTLPWWIPGSLSSSNKTSRTSYFLNKRKSNTKDCLWTIQARMEVLLHPKTNRSRAQAVLIGLNKTNICYYNSNPVIRDRWTEDLHSRTKIVNPVARGYKKAMETECPLTKITFNKASKVSRYFNRIKWATIQQVLLMGIWCR